MGHVAQEFILLVAGFQQALTKPFQLPSQLLDIVGSAHADLLIEVALAQIADGAVDLAHGARHHEHEKRHQGQGAGNEGGGLPGQGLLGGAGIVLQGLQVAVDQGTHALGQGALAAVAMMPN